MRKRFRNLEILLIILICGSIGMNACTESEIQSYEDPPADSLTIMSYNIRFDTPDDGINAWPHRKDKVAEMIGAKHEADIAGLQEALSNQIEDLQERLPEFSWTGMGHEEEAEYANGGFCPIFFRPEKVELLESDTFWLSETPDVPGSKSWDSALIRYVTQARFKDRGTGHEFYVLNTHFDHIGEQARTESAKLLVQRASELPDGIPVIITGDFNMPEGSAPYYIITSDTSGVQDARYVSETEHKGPTASFNNWEELQPPESRVDFIFVRNEIRVLNHRILADRYGGRFPSDHLPVISDIALP